MRHARGPSSKVAVVDLDGTLIEENAGVAYALRLLYYGLRYLPLTLYARMAFLFPLLLLYPFRFLRPVYFFLQRISTYIYFLLERSAPPDLVKKALESTLRRVVIPETSTDFLRRLRSSGYRVIVLSASPQVVVDALLPRLGAQEGYGISARWGIVFNAEGKAHFLRTFLGIRRVDLMVGNPGREPFWMAERSIVVRSPKELNAYTSMV